MLRRLGVVPGSVNAMFSICVEQNLVEEFELYEFPDEDPASVRLGNMNALDSKSAPKSVQVKYVVIPSR